MVTTRNLRVASREELGLVKGPREFATSIMNAGASDWLPLTCFRLQGANASQFGAEAPGLSQAARPPSEPVAMVAPLL